MLLRAAPSLPCVSVLSPSRLEPLAASPFTPRHDRAQVLTFRTKAWSSFAPPTCRMPLGQSQATPELIPEEGSPPGFDIAYPETERSPRTQAGGVMLTPYPRSLMRLASLVTMRALSCLTRKSAPRSWWNVPFFSMW